MAQQPSQFEQEVAIDDLQWEIIWLRTQHFYRMLKQLNNEQLGALVREYLVESQHGSWEGFDFTDLIGISKLLQDLQLQQDNQVDNGSSEPA